MLIPNCAPIILLLGFGAPPPPPPIATSLLLSIENPRRFPVWKNIRTCVTASLLQLQMALGNLNVSLVALTKNNPSNPRSSISPSPSPPSRLFCTTGTYKEALVRDRQSLHGNSYIHMEASCLSVKILSHTAPNTHIL
jgi:hypothetical protein